MNINDLIIEVTRKCNFKCEHCLRGKAQNKNISKKVIDRLLENNIDYINSIIFTGGEPSLNVKAIKYILKVCKEKGIEIGNFYIATNGGESSGSEEFIKVLLDLYLYCNENEISSVQISNTDFHNWQDKESIEKLKCLTFVNEREHLDSNYLIKEGKAKKWIEWNGSNFAREIKPEKKLTINPDNQITNDSVYINCNGDIVLDCDLSYIRQARNRIGNILKDNLKDLAVLQED